MTRGRSKRAKPRPRLTPSGARRRFLPYWGQSPESVAAELAASRGPVRPAPAPKPPRLPPVPRAPRPRDPDRLYSDEVRAALAFGADFYADRGSDEGDEGEPIAIDGYASDLAEAALFSVRKRPARTFGPGTFLNSLAADFVAEGFYRAKRKEAERARKRSAKASTSPAP